MRFDATIAFVSVCALALGLGCATSHPIHRPPTPEEIRAINDESRIRVQPVPMVGFVRRPWKIDHVVLADPEKIVAFAGGAPVAFSLADVAGFGVRRRDRGAVIGAGVGAAGGYFLVAMISSMGYRSVDDPPSDTSFPTREGLGAAALGAVACGAVGALLGAVIGAPEDFPLVLGPPPPPPPPTVSPPPPRPPPPPLPRSAALVVAPSAEVRSAPFKVAPVIVSLARGDRLQVTPTPNAGWRVVFLPDGRVGYIQDGQIEVASP